MCTEVNVCSVKPVIGSPPVEQVPVILKGQLSCFSQVLLLKSDEFKAIQNVRSLTPVTRLVT